MMLNINFKKEEVEKILNEVVAKLHTTREEFLKKALFCNFWRI